MCDTDILYQPSDGDRGSTSIICHVWHRYPVSTKWWWYGINIHYKSCVTQISCINQVMVIGDQHPLYVMCDTDIPYQPSDGDMGSTSIISHVWHRYPVSTKWWWYGINIHYKSCVTQISCINQVMVIWDQHPL